jgi:hypothetical protein
MEKLMRLPSLLAAAALAFAACPTIAASAVAPEPARAPAAGKLVLIGGAGNQGLFNVRPVQGGGWLVAGAATGPDGTRDLSVWKLTADLRLDTAFGQGGQVRLGSSGDDQAADVVERLDAGGRVVGYLVAGQVGAGDGDFANRGWHGDADLAFIGLDPRGRLDPSFANHGVRLLGGSQDDVMVVHINNFSEPGLRLAPTGKGFYVAAITRSIDGDFSAEGMTGSPVGRDAVVLKIGADASLDPSFAQHGVFRIGSEPHPDPKVREANDFLFTVRTLDDGGVAAGGYTIGYALRLADRTLSVPGNAARERQTASCEGKGRDKFCFPMDGMMLRLTADGRLRSSWGDGGVRFVGGGGQEKLYDAFVDHADRTLFVGRTSSYDLDMTRPRDGTDRFDGFIGRLDAKGQLDRTFGETGVVTINGQLDERASRIVELSSGRYAVAYQRSDALASPDEDDDAPKIPGVMILSPSGAVVSDTHLPVFGKTVALAIAPDGSVLLAGLAQNQAPGGPAPDGDDLFFSLTPAPR